MCSALAPHPFPPPISRIHPPHFYPHFTDSVYEEIKAKSRDAVLGLIQKEREGELIERTLIKNILGIFIEVGGG